MGEWIWERRTNCRQLNVDKSYQELSWSRRLQLGLLWLWPSDGGRVPAGRSPDTKERGGHIERTGRCTDNRNLLPGLSVIEWSRCVCAWVCAERSIISSDAPFFMCHLSVLISNPLRDSQILLRTAKPEQLPVKNCGLHTQTQAAEPRTCCGHEGIWIWREDGL